MKEEKEHWLTFKDLTRILGLHDARSMAYTAKYNGVRFKMVRDLDFKNKKVNAYHLDDLIAHCKERSEKGRITFVYERALKLFIKEKELLCDS